MDGIELKFFEMIAKQVFWGLKKFILQNKSIQLNKKF